MSFRTAEGKVKVVIAVDGSARVVKKPEGFSQKWAEHAAKTDASLAEVWRNPQAPKIKPEDLFLSKKFSTVQNNEGTVVSFEVHGLNGKLRGRAEVLFAPDGTEATREGWNLVVLIQVCRAADSRIEQEHVQDRCA